MAIEKKNSQLKVVILTADKFEDMELFSPYFRLEEEGVKVTIAAPKKGHIHGENGYEMQIDVTFDEIDPEKYDLLILPGGAPDGAPTTVRQSKKAQKIARHFAAKNKPIATICHGPYTLVSADLVKGKHLTSYWHDGVPEEIKKAGGIWEDKEVVVDDNLVSSRYPGDLPAFMREIMRMMERYKKQ